MAAQAPPLPPLLPTPPRSEMLPLLPTPQGIVLTMLVSAMPGRADFVQRWDWNKTAKKPCSATCSSSSSSSSEGTGRADSVERWDSNKKYKKPSTTMSLSSSSSYSAGSPGRADSVERWDSKKLATSCTGRGRHDGNNKRLPSPDRASSTERWDLHKKPRPEQIMTQTDAQQKVVFSGPSFYASPDPSMLPMPSFFLLAH